MSRSRNPNYFSKDLLVLTYAFTRIPKKVFGEVHRALVFHLISYLSSILELISRCKRFATFRSLIVHVSNWRRYNFCLIYQRYRIFRAENSIQNEKNYYAKRRRSGIRLETLTIFFFLRNHTYFKVSSCCLCNAYDAEMHS